MIGICHCGHDVSTHFREDSGVRGQCLGRGCDACTRFRDSEKRDPGCPAPPKDRVIDEPAPETPRMWPWGGGIFG